MSNRWSSLLVLWPDCLFWFFTSRSTIFSHVGMGLQGLGWTSTTHTVKCFAQGHNSASDEVRTRKPRVKHSTNEPPRSSCDLNRQKSRTWTHKGHRDPGSTYLPTDLFFKRKEYFRRWFSLIYKYHNIHQFITNKHPLITLLFYEHSAIMQILGDIFILRRYHDMGSIDLYSLPVSGIGGAVRGRSQRYQSYSMQHISFGEFPPTDTLHRNGRASPTAPSLFGA